MKTLYHYTSKEHFFDIRKEGKLKLTPSNILEPKHQVLDIAKVNGKKRQTRGRFTCTIIIIAGERKAGHHRTYALPTGGGGTRIRGRGFRIQWSRRHHRGRGGRSGASKPRGRLGQPRNNRARGLPMSPKHGYKEPVKTGKACHQGYHQWGSIHLRAYKAHADNLEAFS